MVVVVVVVGVVLKVLVTSFIADPHHLLQDPHESTHVVVVVGVL